MIRAGSTQAGIAPEAVGYVEAHGTGTPLGDPIEIGALAAALGRNRADAPPLTVGSVKTNLGHLEAAAGAAGVLKAIVALQAGRDSGASELRAAEQSHRLAGSRDPDSG